MQMDLQKEKIRTARQSNDPGAALRQRRSWFAGEDEAGEQGTGDPEKLDPAGSSAGTLNTDTPAEDPNKKKKDPVPYDEFAKANSARRAAEARLAELEKAQQEREKAEQARQTEEAKKRGEFEQLYQAEAEKVKALTTQVGELERYRALFEEQVKGMREGLPDFVIELLEKMTPLEQAEYLGKNGEKLRKPRAPGLDGGKGNGGGKPKPAGTNPIGSW